MSKYISRAYGAGSGLTDPEREVLLFVTLRHVASELGISDQEAADLLDSYAETGDSRIVGNHFVVAMVVDGQELVRVERAWLRAVCHRADPAMN